METFSYPLAATPTGDLSLTSSPRMDKARLFFDCRKGDRKYLPGFGIEIGLFQPETPQQIKDAQLQRDLIRSCGSGYIVRNGGVSISG